MKQQPKILIIGFGSIGQRHYKNLISLGYKNIFVYDLKKLKDKKIQLVKDLKLSTLNDFDIAFICSPNHLHIKHATLAAKAGCHIFIEKPLSHNLKGIKELSNLVKGKKLIDFIACNMRFISGINYVKKYISQNKLGKIYSINHECGYYLPYWRPGTDYTKNYAAKKSLGGGIILDDIHEFDLMFYLNNFKSVIEHNFIYHKSSNLKIQTEDICHANFKFMNNVLGSVRCDYLQQPYARNLKIVGEKGNLEWEFVSNSVYLITKNAKKKLFQVKNRNLNQMYLDEIKYFLNCVDKKKKTFNDINTSLKVLTYCLKK